MSNIDFDKEKSLKAIKKAIRTNETELLSSSISCGGLRAAVTCIGVCMATASKFCSPTGTTKDFLFGTGLMLTAIGATDWISWAYDKSNLKTRSLRRKLFVMKTMEKELFACISNQDNSVSPALEARIKKHGLFIENENTCEHISLKPAENSCIPDNIIPAPVRY